MAVIQISVSHFSAHDVTAPDSFSSLRECAATTRSKIESLIATRPQTRATSSLVKARDEIIHFQEQLEDLVKKGSSEAANPSGLQDKIVAILKFCLSKRVEIIVFPELSIPLTLLPWLNNVIQKLTRDLSHSLMIVAGSHKAESADCGEYSKLPFDRTNFQEIELPRPVSPVFVKEQGHSAHWVLVTKIAPSPRERGTNGFNNQSRGWRTIPFLGGKVAVLICSDFGLSESESVRKVRDSLMNNDEVWRSEIRVIAVPACNDSRGFEFFKAQFRTSHERGFGVLYANAARYSGDNERCAAHAYGDSMVYGHGAPGDILHQPRRRDALDVSRRRQMYRVPPDSEAVVVSDLKLGPEPSPRTEVSNISVAPVIYEKKYPRFAHFVREYFLISPRSAPRRMEQKRNFVRRCWGQVGCLLTEAEAARRNRATPVCFKQKVDRWRSLACRNFHGLDDWPEADLDFLAEAVVIGADRECRALVARLDNILGQVRKWIPAKLRELCDQLDRQMEVVKLKLRVPLLTSDSTDESRRSQYADSSTSILNLGRALRESCSELRSVLRLLFGTVAKILRTSGEQVSYLDLREAHGLFEKVDALVQADSLTAVFSEWISKVKVEANALGPIGVPASPKQTLQVLRELESVQQSAPLVPGGTGGGRAEYDSGVTAIASEEVPDELVQWFLRRRRRLALGSSRSDSKRSHFIIQLLRGSDGNKLPSTLLPESSLLTSSALTVAELLGVWESMAKQAALKAGRSLLDQLALAYTEWADFNARSDRVSLYLEIIAESIIAAVSRATQCKLTETPETIWLGLIALQVLMDGRVFCARLQREMARRIASLTKRNQLALMRGELTLAEAVLEQLPEQAQLLLGLSHRPDLDVKRFKQVANRFISMLLSVRATTELFHVLNHRQGENSTGHDEEGEETLSASPAFDPPGAAL